MPEAQVIDETSILRKATLGAIKTCDRSWLQHLPPFYDASVKKTPPDTMADHAPMLLSTDWFAPHWNVIGIEADRQKQCFQNGCRDIVRGVVGEA
jgi:hypothetical protein